MRSVFSLLARLVLVVALACALGVATSLGYALVHDARNPLPQAQAIVVISGPGAEDDIAIEDTAERVARGVELWREGHAPLVVLSGSGANPSVGSVPDTIGMRRLAETLGLPAGVIVEESMSYSTLQNGLFTARLPRIEPDAPVLLVTSRYHLARAWASFRWAGFRDVTLVAADDGATGFPLSYASEGVKWVFNGVRAAAASIALALGVPDAQVVPWLA
jgi:uncharacterized SAM-binding protein YcdF (DUF218 family)